MRRPKELFLVAAIVVSALSISCIAFAGCRWCKITDSSVSCSDTAKDPAYDPCEPVLFCIPQPDGTVVCYPECFGVQCFRL